MSLVSFAVYVLFSPRNILTPERAFVSLALFHLLREPIISLPNIINGSIHLYVSHNRIWEFLLQNELDPDAVSSNTRSGGYKQKIILANDMDLHDQAVVLHEGKHLFEVSLPHATKMPQYNFLCATLIFVWSVYITACIYGVFILGWGVKGNGKCNETLTLDNGYNRLRYFNNKKSMDRDLLFDHSGTNSNWNTIQYYSIHLTSFKTSAFSARKWIWTLQGQRYLQLCPWIPNLIPFRPARQLRIFESQVKDNSSICD